MSFRSKTIGLSTILRPISIALAIVYLGWNVFHWLHYQLAPSLWIALTGLPCPTTGGTRAVMALSRGDLIESLRWNAFAVPFMLMGCGTLLHLATNVIRQHRWFIPEVWIKPWLLLIGIAWTVQLWIYPG